MKTQVRLALASVALLFPLAALAQDSDHTWSKTYPVTGQPTLTFETSDASVDFRPCADCHEIRIHVELVGHKLSDYRLEESQTGDNVRFLFKEIPHMGVHISWHIEQTHITVETPAHLTLEARTSDGNINVSGLQGALSLTTGDGNVSLDHVSGDLRVKSGDGHVRITDADGSLDAHTSDASLSVDGLFHALALHTSDGTLNLNLREGSKLTEPSTVQSSDGSVTIHVPQNFAADLNVHTSDGHVDCALPLTLDHYQSAKGDGHELHGKLNGGGAAFTIHTSDGNVKIEQL